MSDEEEWDLCDKRLGEVLAMVKETPCARSAYCKDAEASTRFALHGIADKALSELQRHRATMKRLEEWAAELDDRDWEAMGRTQHNWAFAAELRKRMRTP